MANGRSDGSGGGTRPTARLVEDLPWRLVALARAGFLTPGEVERMLERLRRLEDGDAGRITGAGQEPTLAVRDER